MDAHDKILVYLKENIHPKIKKLILFGSRARGDYHQKSDYDIAVFSDNITNEEWAKWALQIKENAPTLCGMDLVLYNPELSNSLREIIGKEGISIYER